MTTRQHAAGELETRVQAGSWSPPTALMLHTTRTRAPQVGPVPARGAGTVWILDLRHRSSRSAIDLHRDIDANGRSSRPVIDRRDRWSVVAIDDRLSPPMIDRRERSSNHDLRPPTPMIARRDRRSIVAIDFCPLWRSIQNGPKQSTALISPAHSSLTSTVAQCNS